MINLLLYKCFHDLNLKFQPSSSSSLVRDPPGRSYRLEQVTVDVFGLKQKQDS